MIDKRVIIGYLDKRKLNRELRGYTYIIEVLYITTGKVTVQLDRETMDMVTVKDAGSLVAIYIIQ